MLVYHALHQGQADADSLELRGTVQPLKNAEQLVGVLYVEAGGVVLDEVFGFIRTFAGAGTDIDERWIAATRELDGIIQQVQEYLPEHAGIGTAGRQRSDPPIEFAPFPQRRELPAYLLDQFDRLDGLSRSAESF
jgi:hypothetical protein